MTKTNPAPSFIRPLAAADMARNAKKAHNHFLSWGSVRRLDSCPHSRAERICLNRLATFDGSELDLRVALDIADRNGLANLAGFIRETLAGS